MSLIRIIASCAVLAFVVVIAPAMARAQATDGPGPLDTLENPVPRRVRFAAPQDPATSFPPLIVELRVTLDERGRVGEVRPLGPARETYTFYISRPMGGEILAFMPVLERRSPGVGDYNAFVTSATNAVRQWQYEAPTNGPIAFDVKFGFAPSGKRVCSGRAGLSLAGDKALHRRRLRTWRPSTHRSLSLRASRAR